MSERSINRLDPARETAVVPGWLADEMAPFRDDLRWGRTLETLVAERLPLERLERLRDLALVVVRPDASEAHSIALLEHLRRDHDVVPLRLLVRQLGTGEYNRLYRYALQEIGPLVWLHHELYATAPIVIALVSGPRGGHSSLGHRLNQVKGPSSPLQPTPPTSLRVRFKRTSSVHSVMHVADHPGAMIREATLFFSWDTLGELLSGPFVPPAWDHCRALLTFEPEADATVYQAHLHVKRRILASLALDAPAEEPDLERVRERTRSACREIAGLRYWEQREAFRAFARGERPILRDLIERTELALPERLRQVVERQAEVDAPAAERLARIEALHDRLAVLHANWYLSGHEAYSRDDGESLFRLLDRRSVPLSPRLRSLVRTGLLTDINPDAYWNGTRLFDNS